MDTLLNSALSRTILTYAAQGLLGVFLFFLFHYFSRLYQRKFLLTWALSWAAFTVFMASTAIITAIGLDQPRGSVRLLLTIISMAACYWHVGLILLGSFELTKRWTITRKQLGILLGSILLLSIIMVLIKADAANGASVRYVIRIGIKYLIASVCFFFAAAITLRDPKFTRGIGQKTMAAGFVSYGLLNFYYSAIVFYNVFITTSSFPIFFGLIEMFCICIIGLGMSIWLLEDERDKLSKTNQELDSFLYSVSHDLRAPLASVLGLTNLAKLEIADPKATEYMVMIEQRIKKLDLVIGDILQLSRISKAELKTQLIDFNELLSDVIADVKFNQGASAITLRYVSTKNNFFISDYDQVRIILSNLIANAVKYHRVNQPDPYIEVLFKKTNTQITFSVGDNGEGIAEENKDKIFEMFYRASTSSSGTGLGLYIVKEAVSKMNGTISLHSQLGKGSIFKVVLSENQQETQPQPTL